MNYPVHARRNVALFRIIAIIFLMIFSFTCFGLEIDNGRIKLVLHKNIGRFSLYYLSDPDTRKYTSFFLDQDVRTSVISIVVDNKIYRLGESGSFKETYEETTNGARFIWTSKQLDIIQNFEFISSTGNETDGIIVTLTIKNISDANLNVGVRYLFDTYLGESHNNHFKTNELDNVKNESVIEKKNMIAYWISQNIKTEDVGLQVITGSKVTKPDKIIFANWKRLNESSWSYQSSESRDFSARPYSINDSAVCQYYNPASLASGKTRRITVIMGNVSSGSTSGTILTDEDMEWVEKLDQGLTEEIKSDITILENLLVMINKKIESGEVISDKDIDIMEQILEEIKIHIEKYKNQ